MISAYSSALRKSGQIGKLKELLAFSELSPSELEAVVENTALLALEQQLKVDQLSAFPSDPYATLYAVISGKVLDLAGPDFPP